MEPAGNPAAYTAQRCSGSARPGRNRSATSLSARSHTGNQHRDPEQAETIKDAKVTTGLFYDPDGAVHTYRSGRDADAERADKALAEAGVEFPRAGPHPAASHVETKIAAIMREKNITYAVVVINNPRGPCGTDPDAAEPFSCGAVIPAILPEGSTLAIWSPKDPNLSVKLSGKAR